MKRKNHRRIWIHLGLSLGLIPLGFFLFFWGLAMGLGAGSSMSRDDDWLKPVSDFLCLIAAPCVIFVGVAWVVGLVIVLVVRRFR